MQFSVGGLSSIAAMSIGTCLAPHAIVHTHLYLDSFSLNSSTFDTDVVMI